MVSENFLLEIKLELKENRFVARKLAGALKSFLHSAKGEQMAKSKPLTLQISDIIQWYRKKELVINETFQRYSVWSPQAKTFLIDTILHELPIPKLYLRTKLDPKHQTSIREVVDGQQRIRAIVDFADNNFRLLKRSEHFEGFKYNDLDDEHKEAFLGYTLTVEQLLNATDDDIIDIFARLNSYTVTLNSAEKRHAEFQTEFKFAVRKAAEKFRPFIEKFGIFTIKQRFRMADDEFMAEALGLVLNGVTDGGAPRLHKLYKEQDDKKFTETIHNEIIAKLTFAINFLENMVPEILLNQFCKHYQLLMIIAAILHHKYGIPDGQVVSKKQPGKMPARKKLASRDKILEEIAELERAFSSGGSEEDTEFITSSVSSTQRITSRRIRFRRFVQIFGA